MYEIFWFVFQGLIFVSIILCYIYPLGQSKNSDREYQPSAEALDVKLSTVRALYYS